MFLRSRSSMPRTRLRLPVNGLRVKFVVPRTVTADAPGVSVGSNGPSLFVGQILDADRQVTFGNISTPTMSLGSDAPS